MTKVTFINDNISLELACSFHGSVHYHHGRKHGGKQADKVLEKELRVLHLDLKVARRRLFSTDSQEETLIPNWVYELLYETSNYTSSVIHFLPQGHTS